MVEEEEEEEAVVAELEEVEADEPPPANAVGPAPLMTEAGEERRQ